MVNPYTAPATPAEQAAHRYVRILRELNEIGMQGFAAMLDTAGPEEMELLLQAAEVLQASIDRIRRTG